MPVRISCDEERGKADGIKGIFDRGFMEIIS
jgi:hypothetical protein